MSLTGAWTWVWTVGRSWAGIAMLACVIPACRGNSFQYPPAWELGGQTFAFHGGPLVSAGEEGPRRHIPALIEVLPGEAQALDADWKRLSPEAAPIGMWWWGLTEGEPQRVVVIHTETAWDVVRAGANAWGRAQQTAQIFPPEKVGVILVHGPAQGAAETVHARGFEVACWTTVGGAGESACTLVRGPDPDSPLPDPSAARGGSASNHTGQGWTLLLRLGLVDAGLVCRPWKSIEVPFAQTADDVAIAGRGWAYARLLLGPSGIDPKDTDQPGVDDDQRAMLALWSAVQCVTAGSPADLDRYLRSIQLEGRLRANELEGADLEGWKAWLTEARLWVRDVALGWPV